MKTPVRILHLEDNPRDAAMIRDRIEAEGLSCEIVWVDTKDRFEAALDASAFDIVLCDCNLPGYDGLSAMRVARERLPHAPLIVVSGSSIPEDPVAWLKQGASDYLVKERLDRLVPALRQALATTGARLDRERAEARLVASEARLRLIVESDMIGILFWDVSGAIAEANDAFLRLVGFTQDDIRAGRVDWAKMTPLEYQALDQNAIREIAIAGVCKPFEKEYIRKDGSRVPILIGGASLPPEPGHGGVAFVVDISERKHAEEQLRKSLLEKDALLKEVHHRVKNNLQIITSLLRLEAGRDVEPSTRSVLKEMQGRIQSMALLHETLYRSGTFASVDLGAYLKQLAGQSFRALVAKPGIIQLHVDVAPVRVEMDQALPCGLLVNELISNCLKHGFPGGRTGEVRVELRPVDGGDELRLRVSDTGVGLSANFDAAHSTSLGLRLVSDLARQLQGTLDIGSGPGTSMELRFRPTTPQPAGVPGPPSDPGGTLP